MTIGLATACVAVGATLAACGGGSDDADDAGAVVEEERDGGDAAGTTDGEDQPDDADAGWTDADFERLVTTEIDGYTIENARVTEFGNATVEYLEDTPSTTTTLSALVTFQPCDPFVCTDLNAEIDEQRRENARSLLPRIHIDNPDLVEEIGPAELAGRTAFVIYFRSHVADDDGQSTALSYRAITHDGDNLVTVQVSPDFASSGGVADTAEELAARMAPEDGAAVASDILDALSSEFG